MSWSDKYKKSIDCNNPKGFSQRAHCQGKKKKMKEESNPRIPRKKGQPANSKKHSDLYTDENPKGTIHGLGFKGVATAKASVTKIRKSSRSHAHKIQAAVAMEQRAREMGKTTEAAVYRKFINSMKEKTKKMNEGTLHKWFKGSKSKDGKPGWVNVRTGGTCASDEPGEGTPKCVSSAKRASMTKSERDSAARRKKAADPGQQQKTGAAKPTYVSTDKKKMKKEEIELSEVSKKLALKVDAMRKKREFDAAEDGDDKKMDKQLTKSGKFKSDENRRRILKKHGDGSKENLNKNTYKAHFEEVEIVEGKDKKGKGSGKKDACYHKVKSRYSVWPSAYASGALVKCRKVGAKNWGNKSEQVEIEEKKAQKCWPGYEKKGTKKMFGKTYNNCVKKEGITFKEFKGLCEGATWTKKAGKNPEGGLNEKGRKSYEKENPGSDLKAPSKKVGNPRRKSFCARMKGMKAKLTSAKTARDPDSRINKSLRAWNC